MTFGKEAAGLQQDIGTLFDKYQDSVFRLALSYTRSVQDAEDICQTVFLKLLHAPGLQPGCEKAWLMQVTANESRNLLRSFWRRKVGSLDELLEDTLPLRTTKDGELFAQVMALETKYRVVLYLYYYEGYSTAEIARMTHLSKTAVTTRLQRARNKLKTNLEGAGYETADQFGL